MGIIPCGDCGKCDNCLGIEWPLQEPNYEMMGKIRGFAKRLGTAVRNRLDLDLYNTLKTNDYGN